MDRALWQAFTIFNIKLMSFDFPGRKTNNCARRDQGLPTCQESYVG
jgi:hypothetical protein